MKKVSRNIVSMLLVALMALSTVPAFAEGDASELPYLELTVYSEMADYSGEQTGWFAKIIKDKFNIGLNIIAANQEGGDAKFATMMASGDLGDMMIFSDCNGDNFKAALEMGMMYDMDKDGTLATYAPYIAQHYQSAVERSRSSFGGVYGLGHEIQEASLGLTGNHTGGPTLRYDLYKAIGAPKMTSLFDYLDALKQMQALYPVNEDGQAVYAMSYWSDWDGNCLNSALQYALMNGYDAYGFVLWHATEDKTQELLAQDSLYVTGLKWLYTANQMGLLDPDSATQGFMDSFTKLQNGRVLYSDTPKISDIYNTADRDAKGYSMAVVNFDGESYYDYACNPFGGSITVCISSKTEYPERVLEFLDWTYTDEGAMVCFNGPRGLVWELDENNKPYLTELGKQCVADGGTAIPEDFGGGTYSDGGCLITRYMRHNSGIVETTGESVKYSMWTSYLKDSLNTTRKEWADDHEGYLTDYSYQLDKSYIIISPNQVVQAATTVPEETIDLQQIKNTVASVICEYGWKMIYAENEDSFNALYDEMVTKAKGLGYDQVVAYDMECINVLEAARHELYD